MGGRGGRIFHNNPSSNLPIFEDNRKIQIYDEYNKRFLAEFGLKEHLPAKVREKLIVHEKQHYLDHIEQMAIVNQDGQIVFVKTGTQTDVKFELSLAKDRIITHNHPSAVPILSPQDIETFVVSNALEIRATGLTGQVVRVWKDPTLKTDTEAFKKEYERVFQEAMQFASQNHKSRLRSGEISRYSQYDGMTLNYSDNYPDFVKDQIEYLETNMDFKKHGINYARIKEV